MSEAEADHREDQQCYNDRDSGSFRNFEALLFWDWVFLLVADLYCTLFLYICISYAKECQEDYDSDNHNKLDGLGDQVHDPESFSRILIVSIEHDDGPEDANHDRHDRFNPILLQKSQDSIDDGEDADEDHADFKGTTAQTLFVNYAHFI